ncbi:hypothetical protein [Ureibacillus aquaedulcis]|uniref:Oligosaccharide repeat unit polymerase n=1 Tax=Ureibacillus aquaedulcis TaxID=3058421 RepID=A0ABT8GUT5_9BACL|nr:hypothetical protein [Ureibacillus sp. BA0131]MDN4495106.1 hypothetical protein [Ureibacillus sp. BA0131]
MKDIIFISFKLCFVMVLLLFFLIFESSKGVNLFFACLALFFSGVLLFKSRRSIPIFLISFFILYSNYSIIVGEYFVGGELGIPLYEVKDTEIYGIGIKLMLLFVSIVALFLKPSKILIESIEIKPKDNLLVFIGLCILLLFILVFGINRGEINSYSVSITPLYEYSLLIFLMAYYVSGKTKQRISSLLVIAVVFVLQDFYYGGRITSLQIILLLLITVFLRKLSVKFILIGGFLGIVVNSIVGLYRSSYSFEDINLLNVLVGMKDNFFVFDTPIYAYYATATHIASVSLLSITERLESFFGFIATIFIGSEIEIADITTFVVNNYFFNYGGGLIFSHFYFWFGWFGVIISAVLIVYLLNIIRNVKSEYMKLAIVIFIFSVPRWYLYTPLNLFRPELLGLLLFVCIKAVNKITLRSGNQINYNSTLSGNPKM